MHLPELCLFYDGPIQEETWSPEKQPAQQLPRKTASPTKTVSENKPKVKGGQPKKMQKLKGMQQQENKETAKEVCC